MEGITDERGTSADYYYLYYYYHTCSVHLKTLVIMMMIIATPIGTAGASGRFYDITCKYYGHVVGVLRK